MSGSKHVAFELQPPTLPDRRGKKKLPKAASFIGSSFPGLERAQSKYSDGIPFWGNPYWLNRVDYVFSDELKIVSRRLLETLQGIGRLRATQVPIKIYINEKWQSDREDPPWETAPPRRSTKPTPYEFVAVEFDELDLIDWSKTRYRDLTPAERREERPFVASFELIAPRSGLPPAFELVGSVGIYVSADARAALEKHGCVTDYGPAIRVRSR